TRAPSRVTWALSRPSVLSGPSALSVPSPGRASTVSRAGPCRANGEVGGSKPLELAAPPRGMGWGGPVLEAGRGAVEGGATSVAMCASVLRSASGYQGICIHRSVDRGGDDRTIREGEPVSTVEVCALRTCPVP